MIVSQDGLKRAATKRAHMAEIKGIHQVTRGAERDNRCAGTRTAEGVATPLVFGGMEQVLIVAETAYQLRTVA